MQDNANIYINIKIYLIIVSKNIHVNKNALIVTNYVIKIINQNTHHIIAILLNVLLIVNLHQNAKKNVLDHIGKLIVSIFVIIHTLVIKGAPLKVYVK